MSLRDRNGYVPGFDFNDVAYFLCREVCEELEWHFPDSRAATDTRLMLRLLEAAEKVADRDGLWEAWRGVSRDLNNNVSGLDNEAARAVREYEQKAPPEDTTLTELFAAVEASKDQLAYRLKALEVALAERSQGGTDR